jgi:hypothetical protein
MSSINELVLRGMQSPETENLYSGYKINKDGSHHNITMKITDSEKLYLGITHPSYVLKSVNFTPILNMRQKNTSCIIL